MKSYLIKSKSYGTVRFILESSLIAVALKLIIGSLMLGFIIYLTDYDIINDLSNPAYKKESNVFILFFWICIISPVIETVILQWLPIRLFQRINLDKKFIILLDTLLFSLIHFSYGFIYMCIMAPLGVILAWSFIINSNESFLKAWGVTTAVHSIFNFTSFLSLMF